MRYLIWLFLFVCFRSALPAQVVVADPDSLLAEWLELADWEGVSLHPDLAMEWLSDLDTAAVESPEKRAARKHLLTLSVPSGAAPLIWAPDSGNLITPLSMRYRLRISAPRSWEFRLQIHRNAGDTLWKLPESGVPQKVSSGLLIKPGGCFREIVIGDFQVNSGFGVVTGTSPVFGVTLGNPASLQRTGKGLRLYSGNATGRYFRGLAGSMIFGRSEICLFGSGSDRLYEGLAGLSWKTRLANAEFGFTLIRSKLQFPPAVKSGWTEVWQPDFGKFLRTGIWGEHRLRFGIAFSELGWSPAGGFGWIAGIRWFESHGFSAVLRYSGCTAGYPVTYTLFQSGSGLTREGQRVIFSWRYAPGRSLEATGSMDINLARWPGTNPHFANPSTRILQQWKYLSKTACSVAAAVQLDFEDHQTSVPDKLTWKLAFDSDPKSAGKIRFRAGIRQQFQGFNTNLLMGTTSDCSLIVALADKRIRLIGGFRLFTVEAGTDPLYAYEPDVLYGFSAPVLSGSGTGCYLVIRWKAMKDLNFEGKISRTIYSDLKHISEGKGAGLSGKLQLDWMLE